MKKQKLRHTLRSVVSCVGALIVIAGAVACGSSGSSSSATGTNTATTGTATAGSSAPASTSAGDAQANTVLGSADQPTTTIPQTVPLPATPPKGKTIVYLYDGTVTSQTILASEVKAAAAAIGWNYDG